MLRRACFTVPLFIMFAVPVVSAASGTLEFRARDLLTGYAVRAMVTLEGPQSLTVQMDDTGSMKRNLPAGEYRVVVSAPRYKLLKTRLGIGSGRTAHVTAMMKSEKLPEEESRFPV